jgi:glycosyltransferase involved in cell wall biosynthesis
MVQPARVSVLVAVRNAERLLPKCLDSLVAQSVAADLEVLIIESEPRGREGGIIAKYRRRFPETRLRHLIATRPGLYAAWNTGLRHATAEFVMNLNSDDRLRSDAIEILARTLRDHPEVGLVYGDSYITAVANETFERNSSRGRRFHWPAYTHKRLLLGCICGPHPLWRRRLHDEVGFFDESFRIAGDYDMWLRIAARHPLLMVDEPIGLYYANPQGLSANAAVLGVENRRIMSVYFRDP